MLHWPEKKILFAIGSLAILLNLAPYAYQATHPVAGMAYVGSYPVATDKATYLAEIEEGREGRWLLINRYTSEPQHGVFLYIFYILLGHLARVLHISAETILFIARFVFGGAFAGVSIYCIRSLIVSSKQRTVAYLFLFFGAGFAWLPVMQNSVLQWFPEAIPWVRFAGFPHMMAANALLITILTLLYRFRNDRKQWRIIMAGFLSAALNIILPFHALLLYPLVGIFSLFELCMQRHEWKKIGIQLAIYGVIALPTFFMMVMLGMHDALWAAIERQNILPPIPFFELVLGYGLTAIFFVVGIFSAMKQREPASIFAMLWVGTALLLMYTVPVPMHRRFFETGTIVPLAIGASAGASFVLEKISRWKKYAQNFFVEVGIIYAVIVFAAFFIAGSMWYGEAFLSFYGNTADNRAYASNETIEAMRWMKNHTRTDGIVLSSLYNGNLIPAIGRRTVFIGHGPSTVNLSEKYQITQKFFRGEESQKEMKEFLARERISYIFYSRLEKISPVFNPAIYPFLTSIYHRGDIEIYQVAS